MMTKTVMLEMRGAVNSYFGISEVGVIPASAPGPIMLVSGASSESEMCVVAENGESGHVGGLAVLDGCVDAIAMGDGRELWTHTSTGQITSIGGLCIAVAGNVVAGGGVVELVECGAAAQAGDGRSVWSLDESGRLRMAQGGSFCLTFIGEHAVAGVPLAVQDCEEASLAGDSRHLFFEEEVQEFDPRATVAVQAVAPLLAAATSELQASTLELGGALANAKACGAVLLDIGRHEAEARSATPGASLSLLGLGGSGDVGKVIGETWSSVASLAGVIGDAESVLSRASAAVSL